MGYTTDFYGQFKIDPVLEAKHRAYLIEFSESRRMKRDVEILRNEDDPIRSAVNLPLGDYGEYFIGLDIGILDYNDPPPTQPGLWCRWAPNEGGTALEWNKSEKFYNYQEWLEYLIDHFLGPWRYSLNGLVSWEGEDAMDYGVISIKNNIVKMYEQYTLDDPSDEHRIMLERKET